jgi:Cof subfamily protein (haloacid dehalogenase superfamily)
MSNLAKPENIKALVLDLDGTTLGPGSVLSKRTVRAVEACRQRGVRIIIATGRAIEAAERFRAPLGAAGPMIYFNGAVVADMPGAVILSSTLLALEVADFCVGLSRSMGVYYQVFFPAAQDNPRMTLVAEKEGPEREMYYNHTGILAEIGDLKKALARPGLSGCVKSMFLAEPDAQGPVRERIEERFGGSVYIAQTLKTFLEIMDAKVSKGQGLRFVMERLALKPEELIAFGDEENDLPMFEAAGFSVAPSSAKDSVKAAADIVIGSNADDGVAAFLEDFFSL